MRRIYSAIIFFACVSFTYADSWIQKQSLTNIYARATGFSIGNKGYIGTGETTGAVMVKDFWEYDPASNTWTQLADFGGLARMDAVGFSIGSNGYLGTGWNGTTCYQDFWKYDTTLNKWTQVYGFPGGQRQSAVGFTIGSKGYVGTGVDASFNFYNDFWSFNPSYGWTQLEDFPDTVAKGTGFSIGGYGYMGLGESENGNVKSFYRYDTLPGSWRAMSDFGGTAREGTAGFAIGSFGYIGTGYDGNNTTDFWQYDPEGDAWTQVAGLSGSARSNAVGFGIGNNGYIGTGTPPSGDFWEYTPDNITTGNKILNSIDNISIYPNPANNILFANIKGATGNDALIDIYNLLGMKIYSSQSAISNQQSVVQLDVSSFADGVYFIVIQSSPVPVNAGAKSSKQMRIEKFIKN